MDNPGVIPFTVNGGAFNIAGPGTQVGDWVADLDGMLSLSLEAQLLYGSGGASVMVYFQTSLDQGQTPIDIAALQFGTANATSVVNLSGLTPRTAPLSPTNAGLAAGSCIDGVLGDRVRAVVVVTGTYGGQTLLHLAGVAR
jgi:hypothetical protein